MRTHDGILNFLYLCPLSELSICFCPDHWVVLVCCQCLAEELSLDKVTLIGNCSNVVISFFLYREYSLQRLY